MAKKMAKTPAWKHVLAFVLDFFGSFVVFGYIIGLATGSISAGTFSLNGFPALLLFGCMAAYFVVMNKYFGGTFGKKLLNIK